MPHVEWRGNTCRVKWWTGEHYASGRRKYESKGGFTDEGEAYDYGLDRESDVRNQRHVSRQSGKVTLKAWSQIWLSSLDLDPTTIQHYRKILRAQIWPEWGDIDLGDIATFQYQAWGKRLRATYSDNYIRSILLVFGMLMDDAVSHRPPLIPASPVPRTNRRRGRYKRPVREKKNVIHTGHLHQLAGNAQTVWGLTGYVFMITKGYTGMRLGEMFGLRREFCYPNWPAADPDLERRDEALERYCGDDPMSALRVQWQHKYLKDPADLDAPGVPVLAPPKYGSERTLVIPLFLAELLAKLLESHESEWVFPSIEGGPLLTTDFNTYYWKPVRDGAPERVGRFGRPEIPPVEVFKGKRIHLVRHAHKAHLDEDRLPRVAVEERLGHRLQGVEGVYSQTTPEMERRIMEALQARWAKQQATQDGL